MAACRAGLVRRAAAGRPGRDPVDAAVAGWHAPAARAACEQPAARRSEGPDLARASARSGPGRDRRTHRARGQGDLGIRHIAPVRVGGVRLDPDSHPGARTWIGVATIGGAPHGFGVAARRAWGGVTRARAGVARAWAGVATVPTG